MNSDSLFSRSCFAATLLVISVLLVSLRGPAQAADHRDGPVITDIGASLDLNDVYVFRDPGDNSRVVLIATMRGFIVPGVGADDAVFDPEAVYRFEIYNDHVNLESPLLDPEASRREKSAFVQKMKPNRVIDVTFTKREVGSEPQQNPGGGPIPSSLRRPKPQAVSLKLQGFKDSSGNNLANRGRFSETRSGQPLLVSPISAGPAPLPFVIHTIDVSANDQVQLFAGMTDDPFFQDIPATIGFLDSIRSGTPSTVAFSRGRDTNAGYNTLAIALRIPAAMLQGSNGTRIGVNVLALRPSIGRVTKSGLKTSGTLRTVDRVGVPLVNVLLIPFDLKDRYNTSSVQADGSVRFLHDPIQLSLQDLGLVTDPPEPSVVSLSKLVLAHGDLIQLDLSIPNTGTNLAAAFPNGRRPQDDTVGYVLTQVNHGATLDDNVSGNELPPNLSFPFLPLPHQPLFTDSVDDRTRN